MRVYIEEAVIVETYESEPHFPVETVVPELIGKKKRSRGLTGLLDYLFDDYEEEPSSPFGFIGDLFNLIFDPSNGSTPEEEDPKPIRKEPEEAIIVEVHEQRVREVRYAYAEVIA